MSVRLLGSVAVAAVLALGSTARAEVKMGYVDLQKALTQVSEGKAAKDKLEKRVKAKQVEFDKMQDDVKRLKDELETQGAMMKDELKRQKIQDYQRKLMELQDFYLGNQKELAEEEAKLTKPILERFEKILRKLGKDEGYTLIVEKAAVVYAGPQVDLTERLIKEFNAGGGK
jgi:outer membrane protein